MPNLINNSAELKANFGALSLSFTWVNISSFVEDVERDIIAEAIGFDALEYFITNSSSLTGVRKQALILLQRSVSYLTIHRWSHTALYQFEDKALYVAKSTGGAVISDKKLKDLRVFCEEQGFIFLDKAIDLMERNLVEFPDYADSGTRQDLLQGFIKTAADFSKYRNIRSSRITFLSVYADMLEVQDQQLPNYMTPAYYAVYKEKYLDGELSLDEQKLLPLIKKAVAMLTVAEACKHLPVKVTGDGLFINRYNNSIDYEMADPAAAAQVQFLQDDHQDRGERALNKLKEFITDNPLFFPGYVAPTASNIQLNDECSGIVMF
ncbi:hypothetical protein EOD41_10745 [Mucilaginibacter limnophilus]|uniref:Uncharacterized protein n=1 Tax=Mucilaginibacter limnophilus TaxID=1932778 RepID=A0A3S2V1Y9_9SPHI|nr:DUF6712 family protein [Mucilaginibacter limnophilus]RVU01084.1 hypothetical protein EOD41_10745 [Mucilaginibacter limnophilus]